MIRKVITSFVLALALMGCAFAANETSSLNKEELQTLIAEQQQRMVDAHALAESARALGYDEEHTVILLAKDEWKMAKESTNQYTNQYNKIIEEEINQKKSEYPAAATVWYYFKNLGYNDYVCAGILGNIMAEVGGHTLNIQYTMVDGGYYGMCQWDSAYPSVWYTGLEAQCAFLQNTIRYEFDTYGYAYYSGFNYNKFLSLTNEKDAALSFAKCYERCASGSYSARQRNATVAYNYFTS
jgi:hypothetical protein